MYDRISSGSRTSTKHHNSTVVGHVRYHRDCDIDILLNMDFKEALGQCCRTVESQQRLLVPGYRSTLILRLR